MNTILNKVSTNIKEQQLFSKKDSLIVSFSGGPDSVFLVEVLLKLGYKKLSLIYFNHHLREKDELNHELKLCKSYAKEKKLPLTIKSLPISAFKNKYHASIEEAGRFLRRRFLHHYSKLRNISYILMAHHYDDQIESILMRYQKGTHKTELPLQATSILAEEIQIVRPLLSTKKTDILNFLKKNNINYSVDSSNNKNSFQRNKIRHEWIPLLKSINPDLINILFKSSELLTKLKNQETKKSINKSKNIYSLKQMAEAQNKETIIYNFLTTYYKQFKPKKKLYFDNVYITTEHIKNILKLYKNGQTGSYIDLPNQHICYKSSQSLLLNTKLNLLQKIKYKSIVTKEKKEIVIGSEKKTIYLNTIKTRPKSLKSTIKNAYLLTKSSTDIIIRNVEETDEFKPLGNNKKKNVINYLEAQKCDWYHRKRVPVLLINNKVAWVIGYTISEEFKVKTTSKTSEIIQVFFT